MKNLNPNVKFEYLYRDAGNYKNHGSVVFTNESKISIGEIRGRIQKELIDGLYFIAGQWDLESLFFDEINPELDHDWHEFENVELTKDEPCLNRDIQEFLASFKRQPINFS